MEPILHDRTLPEAMGDVPGICEIPLTRAVIQYRDVHEMDAPGGRIEDIGLALVVEGRYASSSEAVDLGSGALKVLDLSTELVVLDWVYEPTLDHVASLITGTAISGDREPLRRYGFQIALRVLERVGFGPLTRPTFLRLGYRDVCRDLDLHEGTSIRIVLGPGRLTRVHLDYDACALVFRTAFTEPDSQLEHALSESFPHGSLYRIDPLLAIDAVEYQVRFPLPTNLSEGRSALAAMRRGLASMIARFEPSRFESLEAMLDTFGDRETLGGLHLPRAGAASVRVSPTGASSRVVH